MPHFCCVCLKPAKFRGGFTRPSESEKYYCEDHNQSPDIPLVESIASMDILHNGKLTAIKELREWCVKQWGYRGGLKLAKELVESIMDEQKAAREQPLTVTFTYKERQKITNTYDGMSADKNDLGVQDIFWLLKSKGLIL